jgi:hypothetical protein
MGFRAIGRILKISYGTVFQWVNTWGKNLELPKQNESIRVVELDEMHTYVGQKTTDGYGKRLIAFVNGDRSTQTGLKKQKYEKHFTFYFFER